MSVKWACVTILAFLAVSAAKAQDLPAEVGEAYVAYTQAVEAQDWETARTQARRAWTAARDQDIDPETVAVLSDNYAQLAAAFREFEDARDAYRDAAEFYEAAGAGDDILAELWTSAAEAALHAGDHSDAIRCADTAGDLAENARGISLEVRAELLFNSRALQANAFWLNGRLRLAGVRAREALEAAETIPVSNPSRYGLIAFIDGVDQAIDLDYEEAAFRMTQAYHYLENQRRPIRYWADYARDRLDDEERARLFRRITDSGIVTEPSTARERSGSASDESGIERRVDAIPLRRRPPQYPRAAQRHGLAGVALLQFAVTEAGTVDDIEVLFSIPFSDFGEAAVEAAEAWEYEPATVDGVPVRREGVVVQMQFVLEDE